MGPACSNHAGLWARGRNQYRSQTDDGCDLSSLTWWQRLAIELTSPGEEEEQCTGCQHSDVRVHFFGRRCQHRDSLEEEESSLETQSVNTPMRSVNTDALWISLEEDDVTDSTDSLEEDDSLGEVTGALYISPADRYQGPVIGGLPSPRGMGRLQDRFQLQLKGRKKRRVTSAHDPDPVL